MVWGSAAGKHDRGRGEQGDVRAALDRLSAELPGLPLLVAGFSFGCWVGLRVGCEDERVTELIGLGAPVNNSYLDYLASCEKPRLLVQGENDQYGSPEKLNQLVESFPANVRAMTQVVMVAGADHFFAGLLGRVDVAITEWVVARHPELAAGKARAVTRNCRARKALRIVPGPAAARGKAVRSLERARSGSYLPTRW